MFNRGDLAPAGTPTPRRHRARLAAAVLAAALVAAGCGGDDDGGSAEPGATTSTGGSGSGTTAAAGDDGGCTADTPKADLTMGTFTEATSLDPVVSRGAGVTGGTEMASIYDTLMRWNAETQTYEPRIAESVEPNDDFTQWTLKLRDDVTFGNGDPFTSAAVKASIARFQAPDSKSRWANLSRNVKTMDTPDDLTVVFTLTDPWATFPYLMAHEVGMIVNPAVVQALGAEAFGKLPKGGGAGAFEPVSFAPGEGIVMQGRDDYWGGPVCIGELTFKYIAGAQATYDAFNTDEFQVAFLRDPKVIAQAKSDGVGYAETLQNGGGVLMINSGTSADHPTTDVTVRRAIAKAIDPGVVNDRVYDSDGLATDALFGEESRLNTIEGPGYDLAGAKALVAEAKAKGFDGKLHMLGTSDPAGSETAIAIQAMLQAAGFTVQLDNNYNTVQMIGEVNNGNYDIVGWGLNIDDSSPWMKLDSFLNSKAPGNVWGLEDADLDAAILATKVAATTDELKEATEQVQDVWNDIAPGAIFSTAQETVIWNEKVKGIVPTQESNVFFADAYVEG